MDNQRHEDTFNSVDEVIQRYGDIINMEHPEPQRHPRMSPLDRAAQFAPFAALSGYEDVIEDTAQKNLKNFEG